MRWHYQPVIALFRLLGLVPGHTLLQHSPLAGQDSNHISELRVQWSGKWLHEDVGKVGGCQYINDVDRSVAGNEYRCRYALCERGIQGDGLWRWQPGYRIV